MKPQGRFFLALLISGVATAAFAGGPIYTFDPVNRIPYAWDLATWPDGQVPVYTDLGTLGVVTNERANEMVAFLKVAGPKIQAKGVKVIAPEASEWEHTWSNKSAGPNPGG